jgi:hypothetical protein
VFAKEHERTSLWTVCALVTARIFVLMVTMAIANKAYRYFDNTLSLDTISVNEENSVQNRA